ncbi:MAG: nucleotidyltransferase domain-containing protein [Deltaproteobacteria bacterium]|nr:nucleotidyltransferase domain-containing protein [Deltaproteobacteria bacterium]
MDGLAGGERRDRSPRNRQDSRIAPEEIVRRLVAAYAPERVYLFGSRARGEPMAGSDYDLLVVVAASAAPPARGRAGRYPVSGGSSPTSRSTAATTAG